MTQSAFVVTVTAQNFQSVVLDGSFERPVLVDFWADWCAPCRMLMPMLAKLAEEYGGRFLLAKVNTEEEQALAAQFGIRSLPTVQLFQSGRAVDQFMGALPESQVREFLDRHLPQASNGLLTLALDRMAVGEFAEARSLIEEARAEDPNNLRLPLAELQLAVAQGEIAKARTLLAGLPIELANDPEALALRGQLRFVDALENAPPEAELTARLTTDPKDSEARYQLAAHQVLRGDYAGALEHLLELMKRDRAFEDDAGRRGMLAVFDLLGGSGDLVARYRARMMNILY
ncbi:thioredoxin [Thiocystis violascens]|uniref:Thioredoxin n=1 Tax=Thiocystis violascens (strain ATCC 17096 / DSM 198 / 6111) TaxID=765911 RepID=I3Y7A7_THIV6|nr:thioredoxin [Thiocystis violascens]AFL72875.1 thioredoxin [Thiocystis violascens DSM 198]